MTKISIKNRKLNLFGEITKHLRLCCSVIILLLMSGTVWAQTPGESCALPIVVNTLPFNASGNTSTYGNNYGQSDVPPAALDAITNGTGNTNYITGDEVVFAFTATSDMSVNISSTTSEEDVALWAFTGCPFASTVGYHTNLGGTSREINGLPVLTGTTYYFVIATWPDPQSTDFTINIEEDIPDCLILGLDIGDACDDEDSRTYDDTVDADCNCVGTPYDCPDLLANIGDACDDADPNTVDDVLIEGCECAGIPTTTNDEACTATAITCGDTLVQSLIGATSSLDDDCTGSGTADVWFSFSTDGSQSVTVGEGGGAYFDAVVQLFEGDECGNLTEVGACQDGPENFSITEAGNYYFRIRPYYSSSDEATISVYLNCEDYDCPELHANIGDACDDGDSNTVDDVLIEGCECAGIPTTTNDEACTATAITCGDTLVQSLIGATSSFADDCDGSGSADVWFSFSSDGSQSVTVGEGGGAYFDAVVQLFEGDECGNLTEVGVCQDGPENFTVTEAGNYYFRVRPYSTSSDEATISVYLNCEDFDCPELSANIGDACDDGDAKTYDDTVGAECNCVGTPYDCPDLLANIGDACDDGDPNTLNDAVTESCECVGIVPDPGNTCGNAILVDCNAEPVTYSSNGSIATNSTDCTMADEGLWFTFTGTGNTITINSSADFDHEMSINTGSCEELENIACKDGSTEDESYTLSSTVSGQTYYVYIAYYSDYYSAETGDITISLDCATSFDCPELQANIGDACDDGNPGTYDDTVDAECNCIGTPYDCPELQANFGDACDDGNPNTIDDVLTEGCECAGIPTTTNDEACTARAITCGDTLVQSLIGATSSLADDCGGSGSSDVWFSFSSDGSQSVTVGEGSFFDAVVQLFEGDECGNLTEVGACKDSPENYTVTEAGNYYFRVRPWSYYSDEATISVYLNCEDFECPDLHANIGDACDDGDPNTGNDKVTLDCECVGTPVPANDNCDGAIALTCNQPIATNNFDATASGLSAECSDYESDDALDVWFSFEADGTSDYTVTVSPDADAWDGVLFVYSGDCDNLVSEGCADETIGNGESLTLTAPAAGTYFVRTFDYTDQSLFTIELTCAEEEAVLNGSVNLNSACGDRNAVVSFYEPGTSNLMDSYNTTVGTDGAFSVDDVTVGTFDIIVKVDGYLAKGVEDVVIAAGGSNDIDLGSITAGDANNDGSVSFTDFSLISPAIGSADGDANYNPAADFNCDGLVNFTDFSLFSSAFGQSGDTAPL